MSPSSTRDMSLVKRVIVALIFAPVILWIFYIRSVPLYIFIGLVTLVGQWELFRMLGDRIGLMHRATAFIASFAMLADEALGGRSSLFGIVVTVIALTFLIEIVTGTVNRFERISLTLFSSLYPAAFLVYYIRLEQASSLLPPAYQRYLFLFILAVIWIFDTASYFSGRAFGRHPFFSRVSPKKTLEGFFGGFAAAALVGITAGMIVNRLFIGRFFILSLLIALAGQAGDLAESIIKRELGVKDSSGIIPGHGGILDRFDSFAFAGPVVYLYFIISALPG